jgi:hypothetical protein
MGIYASIAKHLSARRLIKDLQKNGYKWIKENKHYKYFIAERYANALLNGGPLGCHEHDVCKGYPELWIDESSNEIKMIESNSMSAYPSSLHRDLLVILYRNNDGKPPLFPLNKKLTELYIDISDYEKEICHGKVSKDWVLRLLSGDIKTASFADFARNGFSHDDDNGYCTFPKLLEQCNCGNLSGFKTAFFIQNRRVRIEVLVDIKTMNVVQIKTMPKIKGSGFLHTDGLEKKTYRILTREAGGEFTEVRYTLSKNPEAAGIFMNKNN